MANERKGFSFVFIDETPFSQREYCTRGRAASGKRAIRRESTIKFTSLTAITAIMQNRGVVHIKYVSGSVDAGVFSLFLRELNDILVQNELSSYIFVLDNCAIHKTAEVKVCFFFFTNNHSFF